MRILAAQLLPLVVAQAGATLVPARASFDGHKVFRVPVRNRTQHVEYVVTKLGLDVWQSASGKGAFADIQVPSDKLLAFRHALEDLELIAMHEDLGYSISEEAAFQAYSEGSVNDTWFDSYNAYEDQLQFLQDIQNQHPNNSEIVTSGQSLEGNAITGIHMYGSSGKGCKPAIIFHGTVHACEWITSMWEEPGSSENPCAESFRGESAGDSPETRAFINFIQKVKDAQGLKLYIDYHAYSQLFMIPYGWTCKDVPQNNAEIQALASGAAKAIKAVHGISFETGPICTTVYQASGNSVDYVFDVAHVSFQ